MLVPKAKFLSVRLHCRSRREKEAADYPVALVFDPYPQGPGDSAHTSTLVRRGTTIFIDIFVYC